MTKDIIRLKGVNKVYKMGDVDVHALRGLDMNISRGEFVSIQGPSGSGKSTAVNMVGCLDIPTSGHISLDGKDISMMEESDLAQIRGKKIGFIFQQFNLIKVLSALENIMLPMIFQGVEEEIRKKKAAALLEMVGLGERMHHRPTELSGGQQQRVAIARALANDPEVILADEPTGNLDSKTGATVLDFLDELHKKGKTIIMVTHDDVLARRADRVLFLKDGLIVDEMICKDKGCESSKNISHKRKKGGKDAKK